MSEEKMSLDEMRSHIVGEDEFIFTIERTKKDEKGKEISDGELVVIVMKALSGEENTQIESIVKKRTFDHKDFKLYNEEVRYVTLSYAITSLKLVKEKDGKKEETDTDVSNKTALEQFLRKLTHHTILALTIKYEDAAGKIFDDIKKK